MNLRHKEGPPGQAPSRPWSRTPEAILEELSVDPMVGLDPEQVESRRERFGSNLLEKERHRSVWSILLAQFRSLVVLLLLAAALVALAFGDFLESGAILAVLALNGALGFFMEYRAIRSMEALRSMGRVEAVAVREGTTVRRSADDLVPGDIVLIEGGDVVPADLRVLEGSKLAVDEAPLTGESLPVSKSPEEVPEETELAERRCMLYRGTSVTRGSARTVVVATGSGTEIGHISRMVETAGSEQTPLEKRLDKLGRRLIWLTLVLVTILAGLGVAGGRDLKLMVETALALAVATVPEGLPIVATIALARGMWRMAKRNALVKRLSAVETLGSTDILLTDKTGTLTESRMTVTEMILDDGPVKVTGTGLEMEGRLLRADSGEPALPDPVLEEAVRCGVLCSNAALERDPSTDRVQPIGEPLEVALLVLGAKADQEARTLRTEHPELREVAFDTDTRMMAVYNGCGDEIHCHVKGAPEAVVEACNRIQASGGPQSLGDERRRNLLEQADEMAGRGLRVLALAYRPVATEETPPYEDLILLALVGMADPPRPEVPGAIAACRKAGIRVVMVTGDHLATARAIGTQVNLIEEETAPGDQEEGPLAIEGRELRAASPEDPEQADRLRKARVFARVTPEQKLNLISLHQAAGHIVAMTGDGVNDAPALAQADIGVAMGRRGTQVAREAADMILRDDSLSTIVAAVREGRNIFRNLRAFVMYLLSCNLSEILVVGLASLVGAPLPLLPLQILFLNLVTDVFPALALGVGEGDETIMDRPPRDPQEPVLTRTHWSALGAYGLVITAATLGTLAIALQVLDLDRASAVTLTFLTLASAQLWHVFNMRPPGSPLLRNEVTRNPWVWGAVSLCILLLVAAVYLPPLALVLDLERPSPTGWGLVAVMGLLPLLVGQAALQVVGWWRRGREG